jgi:hypothetical protein
MYTLRKIPDEDMNYYFEEYMDIDESKIIICGNRHFREIGDEKLLSIVEGKYYDEETEYDYETLDELKKVTGKVWETHTMRGYCQGDWNTLYYVVGEVDEDEIELIENFYMGKVTEFEIEEDGTTYHDYVPDDVVWRGKKSICEYFGIKEEETTIYEDDGYTRVYRYKEMV